MYFLRPAPVSYSALDLLDAYIQLKTVDPSLDNRIPYTSSCGDMIIQFEWHYAALAALSKVFGTDFDFFNPEQLAQLPDRPGDWPGLKADMGAALGVADQIEAGAPVLATLTHTLFIFLVKLRMLERHYDTDLGRYFNDFPQSGIGADYARRLTDGIMAGLDTERVAWVRDLLARVLDPAGRTFTAAQLAEAGYPARSWEEARHDDD